MKTSLDLKLVMSNLKLMVQFWKNKLIGKLVKNNDLINPKLNIINDDFLKFIKEEFMII